MINIDEKDEIELAFQYYRKNGFPYIKLTDFEIVHIFRELQKSVSKINKKKNTLFGMEKIIEIQSVNDQKLANYFHPHIYNSYAIGMRSPTQSFMIDKSLRKVMRLSLKYSNEISDKIVNIFLRTVNGTQMCSNFRPTAAKAIYNYLNGNTVLDMSTGYGGRLLGFLASKCNGTYYGVDPNKQTCMCNKKIAKYFNVENRVKIICSAFEDVNNLPKVDVAFTSPPYFSKEIYDEDSLTQSRDRYPIYKDWRNNFLKSMIQKTNLCLNNQGLMAINIQDVKIKNIMYPLVKDTIKIALQNNFILIEKLRIKFSSFGKNLEKVKTEPLLIFKKKNKKENQNENQS